MRIEGFRWWRAVLAGALCLWAAAPLQADVKVPALFTDHLVLQQGMKNRVWGWADPGEQVTVNIASKPYEATAAADGKWMVQLDPLSVGGPHTLTIQGKNTITIQDVLIGEVWICSGQSNMQWSVNDSTDADLERLAAKYPDIRLLTVPNVGTQEPQTDFKGKWELCSPETVGSFSAVGYYFGRQLHQTLNVPIGLIDNAWGGSACEAWIRRDLLTSKEEYKPLIDRWVKTEIDAQNPEMIAKYEAALAQYRKDAAIARQEGKPFTARPPADPRQALVGQHRPANIYNGGLKPIIGYGIRGTIWYQGETNAGRAYQYRELFPLMVSSWREEWGQGDFPFYWVQLADFMAEKSEPGDSAWAELREAQTLSTKTLKNSGQAVIIDIGEGKDIHPKNKVDVGKRLARLALANDYGVNVASRSPEFVGMDVQENKAIIKVNNAGRGLRTFDVQEARGFVISGEDGKWFNANARIIGPDAIEVSAAEVAKPVAVRYAWADNPICNVFSSDGLPLTPFRTDDRPGITANAK